MSSPDPVPTPSRGFAPNGAVGTGLAAGAAVGILVWLVKVIFHDLVTLAGALGVYLHPAGRVPKG